MADAETDADAEDPRHGVEAIEESSGGAAGGLLPFNPRERGPRDVLQDGRAVIYRWRLIVLGALGVVSALLYLLGLPSPQLPDWADVAVVSATVALLVGYPLGKRVARLFSSPDYYLLDQLDAKDGDQLTIKLSPQRWSDLRVLDHEGEERSTSYLKRKSWNGRVAYECDRYYPSINSVICSWQAGATNKELRQFESKVDRVKTQLEKEANASIEAQANAEEIAREQSAQVANYLLAAMEGVTQPGDGDLSKALAKVTEREGGESSKDLLDDLEDELFDPSNGHGETDGVEGGDSFLEELHDRVESVEVDLGGEEETDE